MRKFICTLNLLAAIASVCLALVVLGRDVIAGLLQLVLSAVWVWCAVTLLKGRLWPWIGSLLALTACALQMGNETLRLLTLSWRAEGGDRSVQLDPSTVGIPLFFFGLFTIAALCVLTAVLSLPFWKRYGSA